MQVGIRITNSQFAIFCHKTREDTEEDWIQYADPYSHHKISLSFFEHPKLELNSMKLLKPKFKHVYDMLVMNLMELK